jgi:hypothetical protein
MHKGYANQISNYATLRNCKNRNLTFKSKTNLNKIQNNLVLLNKIQNNLVIVRELNPSSTKKKFAKLQHKLLATITPHTNSPQTQKINHHQLAIFQKCCVPQTSQNSPLPKTFPFLSICFKSKYNLQRAKL